MPDEFVTVRIPRQARDELDGICKRFTDRRKLPLGEAVRVGTEAFNRLPPHEQRQLIEQSGDDASDPEAANVSPAQA